MIGASETSRNEGMGIAEAVRKYGRVHDLVSNAVEEGLLSVDDYSSFTAADYRELVDLLAELAGQTTLTPSRVLVSVSGGVAYVEDCPAGVEVEIIDYDNLEADIQDAVDLYYKSEDDSPGQDYAAGEYERLTGERFIDRPAKYRR